MQNYYSLHIGIDEYRSAPDLSGCMNDALAWQELLRSRHFLTEVLQPSFANRPTIIQKIGRLIELAKEGSYCVVTYSGHGTHTFDSRNADEYYDEAWVLGDGSLVIDDDLRQMLDTLRVIDRMVIISDSCHSGGMVRSLSQTRLYPATPSLPTQSQSYRDTLSSTQNELFITACGENELAQETTIDGVTQGVLSRYLINLIRNNPSYTWEQLITAVIPVCQRYNQTPTLQGNKTHQLQAAFL